MVLDDLKGFPRNFRVLIASALIENMAFGLIIPFLAIYVVEDMGLDEWMAGVVLAGYTIAGVPSMIIGGMLADKIGRRPVLLASLGLMQGALEKWRLMIHKILCFFTVDICNITTS